MEVCKWCIPLARQRLFQALIAQPEGNEGGDEPPYCGWIVCRYGGAAGHFVQHGQNAPCYPKIKGKHARHCCGEECERLGAGGVVRRTKRAEKLVGTQAENTM